LDVLRNKHWLRTLGDSGTEDGLILLEPLGIGRVWQWRVILLRCRECQRLKRDRTSDITDEALAAKVEQDLCLPEEEIVMSQFDSDELAMIDRC
jgi:hypothetical protein